MISKHIKIAVVLLCFLVPLFCFGLYQNSKNFYTMSRGNYFFQNTRKQANLETIILDFGNNHTVTIMRREGLWRIKEADDYFAASLMVNILFKFITDTVIYRADAADNNQFSQYLKDGIKVTCIDNKGNILDSAVISPKKESGYLYASLKDSPYLYQLNGDFKISPILLDWVQMPILSIDYEEIKHIDTDNFQIYRRFAGDELKSSATKEAVPHIRRLTNNLYLLNAQEIKHVSNLGNADFIKIKHYDVTLLNGMIYSIDIYKKQDDYWLNIKLDNAIISTEEAALILKERRILYDGWFFKIDRNKGQIISDFIL